MATGHAEDAIAHAVRDDDELTRRERIGLRRRRARRGGGEDEPEREETPPDDGQCGHAMSALHTARSNTIPSGKCARTSARRRGAWVAR